MEAREVYLHAYGRIRELVHTIAAGLDATAAAHRPDPEANSIAWLLWHLTRVQDDHVSEIAGRAQAWVAAGWAERFAMAPDPTDTGYGHTSAQVAAVAPADPGLLVAYHDAVADRTAAYLETLDGEELDRIIDERWDPPVSVGVRLVSVIGDSYQHAGQAAYVRGMYERRT
jgi:uncharacterized damage-inducible protein DinB